MLTSIENEWYWRHNFLIFWKNNSIAFKWAVTDSEAIRSSVDTDETVIAHDIITEKYDVSRIMK